VSASRSPRIAELTTLELRQVMVSARPSVALVPVGSTEPHGPHLPLATDVIISEAACARAVAPLAARGVVALIAPAVPYGVTECAEGFAGAVSVPAPVLTELLAAVAAGLLAQGFSHVCLVNNHLEPAHDAAVRAAARTPMVSVACPLTRRWARTLSEEFKRGACHAGRYETSIVMAARPAAIDDDARAALPEVPISLSQQLAAGVTRFIAMGMTRAYAGAPAEATAGEGEELIDRLAAMVAGEVLEALGIERG
jgi:creatinine amidohydrolase